MPTLIIVSLWFWFAKFRVSRVFMRSPLRPTVALFARSAISLNFIGNSSMRYDALAIRRERRGCEGTQFNGGKRRSETLVPRIFGERFFFQTSVKLSSNLFHDASSHSHPTLSASIDDRNANEMACRYRESACTHIRCVCGLCVCASHHQQMQRSRRAHADTWILVYVDGEFIHRSVATIHATVAGSFDFLAS